MSKTIAEILMEMGAPSTDLKQGGKGSPTAGTPQSSAAKAGKWEDNPTTGEKMKAQADYNNLGNKGSEQGRDEPENSTKKDLSKAVTGDTAKQRDMYKGGKPAVKEGTRVGHGEWGEGVVIQVNEDNSFDALFEHGVEMNLTEKKGEDRDPNRDERDELEPKADGENEFYKAHTDNRDDTDNPEEGKPEVGVKSQAPTRGSENRSSEPMKKVEGK